MTWSVTDPREHFTSRRGYIVIATGDADEDGMTPIVRVGIVESGLILLAHSPHHLLRFDALKTDDLWPAGWLWTEHP